MILAETIATGVNWTLICAIVLTAATVAMWWDARRQRPTVISPQPLTVEIIKSLHEKFASLEEFKKLSAHTTDRHNQLFKGIEKAKEHALEELEKSVSAINADRAKTMDGLRRDFDSIRDELTDQGKDIAGLKKETEMQNMKLNTMDGKLDGLPSRIIADLRNAKGLR
jgi:hypothetical protein